MFWISPIQIRWKGREDISICIRMSFSCTSRLSQWTIARGRHLVRTISSSTGSLWKSSNRLQNDPEKLSCYSWFTLVKRSWVGRITSTVSDDEPLKSPTVAWFFCAVKCNWIENMTLADCMVPWMWIKLPATSTLFLESKVMSNRLILSRGRWSVTLLRFDQDESFSDLAHIHSLDIQRLAHLQSTFTIFSLALFLFARWNGRWWHRLIFFLSFLRPMALFGSHAHISRIDAQNTGWALQTKSVHDQFSFWSF